MLHLISRHGRIMPPLAELVLYRVYSFSYFKYGIYKPREVKKSDKETSAKHEFLYRIFFLPPEVSNSHI